MLTEPENNITAVVKDRGFISFHDYMDLALYHPEHGYYMADKEKIGPRGDYYTSCSLGPVFGILLARQINEMSRVLQSGNFTIVEYGAGSGKLCLHLLQALKKNPELYESLKYVIIEKSPAMRRMEQDLIQCEKVTWTENISAVKGFTGCVLAHEVLDNFPVHALVMKQELMEIYVQYNDGFEELLRPAPDIVKQYFTQNEINLPPGFRTELNCEAEHWIKEISEHMKSGYVLAMDYGLTANELYQPSCGKGTLVCYRAHRANNHFYDRPGTQDITTHVNFSALYGYGKQYGLEGCGYITEAALLDKLGLGMEIKKQIAEGATPGETKNLFFAAEELLYGIGRQIKVLLLKKGDCTGKLTGFS